MMSHLLRKIRCSLVLFLGISPCVLADPSDLIINEIQVSNLDMFIDPSFNYGGWIELYNPSDETINLYGLFITDDPANVTKFRFPAGMGTIAPKAFRAIWFDHNTLASDTRYSSNAYKQVNFKLTYEGGTIYLYDSSQELIATQSYPPAISRCSYARTTDGGDTWSYCSTPTPAASNEGSTFASEQLPPPSPDRNGTVFTAPFTMVVPIPSGYRLYYTTDGSTPSLSNGNRSYTGSFRIADKSVVYRLRFFCDGYLPSPVVSRTFIYKDQDYYLPIVSVLTDEKNLYDNRIGVYVDGNNGTSGNNKDFSNKNRAWERPVNFEYFVPDSNGNYTQCVINQETDFEVCGGWSRHFSPSSFRLKGTKKYEGNKFLPYPFFSEDKPYIKNKVIQVRNGGNDTGSRILDAGIHECIIKSGFYLDCLSWQPVHVFFNGVFQYTYNMREPSNKTIAYSNYGIDTEEVDQFEINVTKGYEQKTGDNRVFNLWITYARQLATYPTEDSLYQKICEIVDIDEYCNYMAAECYIGSSDWLTNCNNVKGFRSRNDGKFHLVMLDVDAGFSMTDMVSRLPNSLNDSRYNGGRSFLIDIYLNMLKYAPFKKRFIDTYCIVNGSVFNPERCNAIISAMANTTTTALSWESRSPWSSANSLISRISNENNRSARMNTLRNYFGLQNKDYNVRLNSNIPSASLQINGIDVPTGRFDGPLFKPATITSQAPAGYHFVGWQSDEIIQSEEPLISLNDDWSYYDQGSLDDQDWKSRYYNASQWQSSQGPFGFGSVGMEAGSADYTTTLDYGGNSGNKRPTYYFRNTFRLNKRPKEGELFQFTYYVDDGCVIYLNGTEIARYHMPEGTPNYSTYSTTYEGNKAYSATLLLDNNLLKSGTNVIAVEVHNCSASSSDIYWGATLEQGAYRLVSTQPSLELEELSTTGIHGLQALYTRLDDQELLTEITAPLRINEVSAGNSVYINDSFKKNDWFELFNTTDTDLDAAGLYLSDDRDTPDLYQVPVHPYINTIVPAHGHLVLWADNLESISQLHAGFKLGNNNGEMVVLNSSPDFVERNAAFFEEHPDLATFADGLTYPAHTGEQSVGRYPDGSNSIYLMHRPTIGRSNSIHSFDWLVSIDPGIYTGIRDAEELTEEPAMSSTAVEGYYSLSGLYLGANRTALRPGLYVLRQSNGTSRKVMIR